MVARRLVGVFSLLLSMMVGLPAALADDYGDGAEACNYGEIASSTMSRRAVRDTPSIGGTALRNTPRPAATTCGGIPHST